MKRFFPLSWFLMFFLLAAPAQAVITVTNNVTPSDPTEWDGATTIHIGDVSSGSLRIDGGSSVLSQSSYIGYGPDATGTATVEGTGSTWVNNGYWLTIGHSGVGALNVLDGGTVSYSAGIYSACCAGYEAECAGTIKLSGKNSTLNSFFSFMGEWGRGELNITEEGTVNTYSDGLLGLQVGSTGIVNVSDGSSWYVHDELCIGGFGYGELNITRSSVSVARKTMVGYQADSPSAIIHFDNGTLMTGSLLAASNQLAGTGAIYTGGLLADGFDLVFDQSRGLQQTMTLNDTSKNITLHIDCRDPEYLGAGYRGAGTLTIQDGHVVGSSYGYLGYQPGSSGVATVSGTDTRWNISTPNSYASNLHVGYCGHGELNITDGAVVSVQDETWIGRVEGSSGAIHFQNGTLTTNSLYAGSDQLSGTGTIHAKGFLADGVSLVFDSSRGLQQTFVLSGSSQNITFHLDQTYEEVLGAGYTGNGSLTIRDGLTVENYESFLGYWQGSTGTASVTGSGSTWSTDYIHVGLSGSGRLSITNGGTVNSDDSHLGYNSGATGTTEVSGSDSLWNCGRLVVGYHGTGELLILDGGTVNACNYFSLGMSGMVHVTSGGILKLTDTRICRPESDSDSFINMSTGGMLAIGGEADESIGEFLDRINGTDTIRWWDDEIGDWAMITTAVEGVDYTLEYCTEGDLDGYTVLTVGHVPEPSSLILMLTTLLAAGLVPALKKRFR